jgi:alkyl sulfatase BDS1-like metallo-beta-lactamase superfamily hydrolase
MIATKAGDAGMPYTPKDATPATVKANQDAVARYAMEDRQDFTDADRGFIAGFPGQVLGPDGQVFDLADYEYLADDARVPDTVNPSLWRQSQVMHRGGLYKVVDGLFQARNNDIANLTIVEGDDGRPRSSSLTWTPPAADL